MRRARQGILASRWCRRTVVVTLAAALVAGGAGPGSSVAALSAPGARHSEWQPPASPAAASEPTLPASGPEGDPEQEAVLRQLQLDLLADIAAFDEDEEVRAAARDTLRKTEAGDATAIPAFFDHGQQDAKAAARKRKADADAFNRAVIEPLAGTGGPVFNAAVARALAGNAYDRADFLAFGRDIAAEQDRREGAYDTELKNRRRMHVQVAADRGTPEVSAAAKAALAAGDAAIAEFLKTGYLAAAQRDADARERYLAELEQKRKDAVAASDLAQRTARAMRARTNLLAAHADGVKALERTANDMTSAARISRETARLLASDQAGHTYHPELYQRAKDDVAREVGRAVTDAQAAQAAAAGAKTQVDILLQNGMPHGTQWAKVVEGMAGAADAAKRAAETAAHAIDAISADAAATDAAEKARAHEENARQWRLNAESHAAAAAQLAQAAKEQATAAAEAAELARQARVDAETALRNARAHAANVKQARVDAERERDVAAAKRQEAEHWRQQAAAKRQEAEAKQRDAAQHRDAAQRDAAIAHQKRLDAEAQQRIAAGKRGDAQAQEQIAADAARDARAQEKIAQDANTSARNEEANAFRARDEAAAIAQSADTADKKATFLEGLAQRMQQSTEVVQADKDKAWAAAHAARADANKAKDAALIARGHANNAQAAAGRARGAAIEADAAAGRARAHADAAQAAAAEARAAAREAEVAAEKARTAANEAQAAAARANEAATRAEREAAAVHAEALRARASAEEATAAEARAAENARNAANLAQQAAVEAAITLDAAHRTGDEANAAGIEAATAATQAGIAARAATASVQSASGIAAPADQAISIVSPFSGTDIDADFIVQVANRAKDVGNSQVEAAQAAATDAAAQAQRAADAARNAAADVAPAFQAASAAASSAAAAARSAAAAQQSAADAAIHGAAARKAAADAAVVDAGAQADAQAARAAANQAAADAALAGRLADQAEADARAARQAADNATRAANEASAAATRAEQDAAAAQQAAEQAQRDADAARTAANRAAEHARDADQAASRAEGYAKDTESRANNVAAVSADIQKQLAELQEKLRLEHEARQRAEVEQAITDDSEIPELTQAEADALRTEKGQAAVDDYNRARAEANKPLLDFIVAEGGQIILDIVGFTDAKRCFTEGDFIACVMTVINALPILKIASVLSKIPDAVSAVVRIVKGIRTFKDLKVAGRRLAGELRDLAQRLIRCKPAAMSSLAGPGCEVQTKPKRDPHAPPVNDPRRDPYPFPGPLPEPGPGEENNDRKCPDGTAGWVVNDRMQNFTYNNVPASRATGGTACIITALPRQDGDPDTPAGHIEGVTHRSHLIASMFGGVHNVQNIVPLHRLANTPVMQWDIEEPIARAVRQGERVYYRVSAYYNSPGDALPARLYIKAWGMEGKFRCLAIVENVPNPPRTACQ
ncbi:hypothetical protein AVR91_0211720 [Amycolatopsis keratiniphila subsp. keratiniphila]|uniref:Type VII secretion system protein EssD-like domain-containing protein n=1 Tax=Amycolatopsis keratiniphila subsp. keratiniphila TaxID=227715 RepID=A0A1W2LWS2_9PSEU|nr:hypothetical protein AVR91_0211720 [Amycolatopsis keratiniphila subsp. keratiniphila]